MAQLTALSIQPDFADAQGLFFYLAIPNVTARINLTEDIPMHKAQIKLAVFCASCALLTPPLLADGHNLTEQTENEIVMAVIRVHRTQKPMPYITHKWEELTIDEAYEVQEKLDRRLARNYGPKVGFKVGYASKAAQKQFGVKEPARGSYFLMQRLANGQNVPSEAFMNLMLETEVAFTIDKAIAKPLKTITELKPYIRYVHPALDVGDFRFVMEGPKGVAQDMIASGTGAHLFVVGRGKKMVEDDIHTDQLTLKLSKDGKQINASPSSEVMGDPLESCLWCVNDVLKRGGRITPGMIILTGTAAPAFRGSGDAIKGAYVGDCGELGQVKLVIE